MEYVYGAMLLHSAGQEINEDSLDKVLSAANVKVDKARAKALIASLEDVNIEEAIATAAVAAPAPSAPAAPAAEEKAEEKEEEKSEEEEAKKEEEAAEGLASLFG